MATNKNNSKTKKSETKRKLEKPKYKTFRLQKKIKNAQKPLPKASKIMRGNLKHLLKFWRLYLGIAVIYFIVSVIMVSGLVGGTDVASLKDAVKTLFAGGIVGQLSTGVTLFGVLLSGGNSGNISESGSIYQTLLLVIVSLVTIWALRQTYAKVTITVKDAYYKSMMPFIPFILVLGVIGLQLLPLLAGTSIYSIVISQGLAATTAEKAVWVIFVISLIVLTLYMITSSVFALYIVTLPDVTPMQALRSARELVRFRRWTIMRKVLYLPFVLLFLGAVIMIPVLLYVTVVAQWVFLFLGMFSVIVVHGYMYKLYRELL